MTTNTLPKLNVPLLLATWKWINVPKPDKPRWNQGTWFESNVDAEDLLEDYRIDDEDPFQHTNVTDDYCGSACCVAGYAMLKETDRRLAMLVTDATYRTPDGEEVVISGADSYDFMEHARCKLGLTDREADELFEGSNTKDQIRDVLNRIFESRGSKVRVS